MADAGQKADLAKLASGIGKDDHLYLVDGSGFIFRAFHALPNLTRKSDGLPVGAVSGFCNMLAKVMDDAKTVHDDDRPTHLAVIFDTSRQTFRTDIYPEYKANRDEPPEDLKPQFGLIRDATRAFGVPAVELAGYEADDLIATYAEAVSQVGGRVTIISSDKDLMQLVTDRVHMLDTMKNREIGPDQVVEKFGVTPDKVVEVQALAGDSVDNVPGVPGIGIKTAAQLLAEYGDLENLLASAEQIKQPKRRENLLNNADKARISLELVTLAKDAPIDVPVSEFVIDDPDADTLLKFLTEMEFNTLTKRMSAALGVDAPALPKAAPKAAEAEPIAAGAPGAMPFNVDVPIKHEDYECVTTMDRLQAWVDEATAQGYVAVDTETTGLDAMSVDLVGVSLATKPGRACYIPLGHTGSDGGGLALEGDTPNQIPLEQALAVLRPLLADPSVLKIGQNLKYDMLLLSNYDVPITPIDDTMLLSYVLDSGQGGHGMDKLSATHLGHTPIAFSDIAGKGKKQLTFDQIPLDQATTYAAEDADITLRLWGVLKPRLAAEHMTTVYETLERPLVPVLVDMEAKGVEVDASVLQNLSARFADKMAELETGIHKLAGEEFNIGSPKQLGEILFDKMGLDGGKKTKTGAWQTNHDVLEALAAAGHELPQQVLEWRSLSKLKSTYTDQLPGHINAKTGRVHTSYAMASTSTGRLSSTDPNLQNIPIRTAEGREIRTAFVPAKGYTMMSADYSQIELRVLAHIADIDALKKAFNEGLDIHAMTASEMFNTPIEGMDPMVRRQAKAINFGIIYGISAFGLANQLGIDRGEAKRYIDAYFERFPGIRDYMDNTKAQAHEQGYVSTIFGRKINLPGIKSKSGAERSFMERAAINAPIQGSAADIIRRAMIRLPGALAQAGLGARMLLQVHDELIFEVPTKEVDATRDLVKAVMEGAAAPALELSVPLDVDAGIGANWDEAH